MVQTLKLRMRITSTCVENTSSKESPIRCSEDHLHMRGEYSHALQQRQSVTGSPPHAWRIPNPTNARRTVEGITSTCVENTNSSHSRSNTDEDHLHMRGEYAPARLLQRSESGSPPHAWRIPRRSYADYFMLGITSTCVENTVNKSLYNAK